MSWLLLFLGVFMMVIELKLPGIGLPGIISALAFLLFFWSHYLSGTADQLEIILFLIGLVCLAWSCSSSRASGSSASAASC